MVHGLWKLAAEPWTTVDVNPHHHHQAHRQRIGYRPPNPSPLISAALNILWEAWRKLRSVCEAHNPSSIVTRTTEPYPPTQPHPATLLSSHAILPYFSQLTWISVLDNGTGFVKAGYAGQVCPHPLACNRCEDDLSDANLNRTSPTTNTRL